MRFRNTIFAMGTRKTVHGYRGFESRPLRSDVLLHKGLHGITELALGRKMGMTIETVRRVMMVLLVLVVGGLLVYGAFMLAEIASSVSH